LAEADVSIGNSAALGFPSLWVPKGPRSVSEQQLAPFPLTQLEAYFKLSSFSAGACGLYVKSEQKPELIYINSWEKG